MLALITSAVTSLIPWAGPRSVFTLAIMALAAVTLGAVWFAGSQHGSSKTAAAIARCDAKWRIAIAKSETQYAKLIAEAQGAAQDVEPAPADRAALDRLCQQSPSCRDRGHVKAAR
jgi:acyl-coenzyme A synthetase/AMP-(fatty) acid ligase